MALKLNETYPGRANNPSAAYPQGSFKNRTAPGAQDGTYLEQQWANDLWGFTSSLIAGAGIVPNGSVDEVGASQYYDALEAVIKLTAEGRLLKISVFDTAGASIWTPDSESSTYVLELMGGGGAGGGAGATGASNISVGGGGGAAAYLRTKMLAVPVSPVTITIGAGGVPVSAGGGGAGGTSSFGALFTANGGMGGVAVNNSGIIPIIALPGTGSGTVTGNAADIDHVSFGAAGGYGIALTTGFFLAGQGGASALSGGGHAALSSAGNSGGIGAGGSGGARAVSTAVAVAGGPGGRGYARILEFK